MADRRARALCLISGGLDSILAARLMLEQNVEAIGVTFTSIFTRGGPLQSALPGVRAAQRLGIPSVVSEVSDELFAHVREPAHGHGSHLNPCIDCRIMILRKAAALLRRTGADFVTTGEVIGQRPMSQRRQAMQTIERDSGLSGRILRPLCAQHLPPTLPEQQGLVDRDRLLDLRGRGRRRQMTLAEQFAITEYQTPAGGCQLTDPGFSTRLAALLADQPDCTLRDVALLRLGRHFRLRPRVTAIVARNAAECDVARRIARPGDILIELHDAPGPTTLLVGPDLGPRDWNRAAALTASYSRHSRDRNRVALRVRTVQGESHVVTVAPAQEEEAQELSISL